jgi:prevent-host-death family protein
MQYFSSTDARNNFSEMMDKAKREPLVIQKKGRDAVVMMSIDDFERIRRRNADNFFKIADEIATSAKNNGLTQEILDDILKDVN